MTMLLTDQRPKPVALLTDQRLCPFPVAVTPSYDEVIADTMNAMAAAFGIPVELLEAANRFPNRAQRRATRKRMVG